MHQSLVISEPADGLAAAYRARVAQVGERATEMGWSQPGSWLIGNMKPHSPYTPSSRPLRTVNAVREIANSGVSATEITKKVVARTPIEIANPRGANQDERPG